MKAKDNPTKTAIIAAVANRKFFRFFFTNEALTLSKY
jgi:hypothetical protein